MIRTDDSQPITPPGPPGAGGSPYPGSRHDGIPHAPQPLMLATDPTAAPTPMPEREVSARPPTRRRTLALFLAFLGFYLLTTGGHLYATDEETLFRVTEAIVERRSLALPDDTWGLVLSEQPSSGRLYSQYQPGQSVAAIPLYLAGRAVAPLFPPDARAYLLRFVIGLFGAFVTAATVALLYRLIGALGYGEGVAVGLAAIYGVATFAWPYARTFYAEPLTTLLLLLSFYGAVRSGRGGFQTRPGGSGNHAGESPLTPVPDTGLAAATGRAGLKPAPTTPPRANPALTHLHALSALRPLPSALIAGLAAGLALLVKPHAALVLPCLGLYLLGRTLRGADWSARVRSAFPAVCAWGMGLAAGIVPILLVNAAIYGGPLRTGYSAGRLSGLAAPLVTGFAGLLLSSGKGFLWYSPPVLLAVLGAWPFFRRHRAEALACLGVVLVHLAFYARLSLWSGDWAWGPRYHLIMLPFALLPAAAILALLPGRRVWQGGVAIVVALGVGVQLLGVLVNPVWDRARVFDDPPIQTERLARIDARFFTPSDSPLAWHARYLARNLGEWRARAAPPPDTAVLGGGFATPEQDPARATFPRWTTGAGTVALHAGGREPLTVKLTFFDHRPAALRGERPTVVVGGAALPEGAVERRDFSGDGTGWTYQFVVPVEALRDGRATVVLSSPTWNPRAAGAGDRDEALGVFVHNVEVWRGGRPWRVRDEAALVLAHSFGTVPASPPDLYRWFNGDRTFAGPDYADPVHHLADHWAWYAAVAGLDRATTTAWIATYGGVAAALTLVGLWLGARTLPPGALARRRRARKARRGRAAGRVPRPRPARR